MIPKKIKIGGRTYNIEHTDIINEEENCDGMITYEKRLIELKNGLNAEYKSEVLLHETIHGIFDFLGWKQNENKVEQLSNVLYQVLHDNKLKF